MEAEGIALRQMYQDLRIQQKEGLKGKSLSTLEAFEGVWDFAAEQSRRQKRIQLEYQDKDRALRLEFARVFSDGQARTASGLSQLAKARQWSELEWRFNSDWEQWSLIRELTFQQNFTSRTASLEALLSKYPSDPWISIFFVHNTVAEDVPAHQKHLELAASAALRIPGAAVYDDARIALLVKAARAAREVLRHKQSGRRFGEGDPVFAEGVYKLWTVWAEHQPNFAPSERIEGQTFALAATGRLAEALQLAEARDRNQLCEAGFAYSVVRLATRMENFAYALQWLEYGLKNLTNFDVVACRTEPDIEALRKAKPNEFVNLTAVRCDVICDRGWVAYDVVLTNKSSFPLTNLQLIIYEAGGPVRLPDKEGVEPGQECKWSWVGLVGGDRNRKYRLRFELKCAEGSYSS